jgi:hypothetical protein
LLQTEAWRGTICKVRKADVANHIIDKINGDINKESKKVKLYLSEIISLIEQLIKGLGDKDFEILIDLIFNRAGWKRISKVGGTEKDIDIDLEMPITSERVAVQIKSQTTFKEFISTE